MVIKGYIIYIYISISSEYSHAPYVNSCVAFSVNMTIKKVHDTIAGGPFCRCPGEVGFQTTCRFVIIILSLYDLNSHDIMIDGKYCNGL